jgi:hypothetical protein
MDNIKNKNKSISNNKKNKNYDENIKYKLGGKNKNSDKSDKSDKLDKSDKSDKSSSSTDSNLSSDNKNNSFNSKNYFSLPKSISGRQCIGPCYPAETLFYHPMYLRAFKNEKDPTCPVIRYYDEKEKEYERIDKCKPEDITKQYEKFEIFEDVFQIAINDELFLSQIYNINNLNSATEYLNETLEILPVFTQKRLLNAIYTVWSDNKNFPVQIFCERAQYVLKEIYKIDVPIEKIKNKIIDSKKYNDIFLYFDKKYSKKK